MTTKDGAMKRKLIEVSLPLEAINKESAREKSIRHGHPSTRYLFDRYKPPAFQEPFAGVPASRPLSAPVVPTGTGF